MQNFSNANQIDLQWIKIVLYGFTVLWFIAFCLNVVNRNFNLLTYDQEKTVVFAFILVSVLLLGYRGIKHTEAFAKLRDQRITPVIEAETIVLVDNIELLYDRVRDLLEDEKLFLDPNLSLNKISERLEVNINYISKCINSCSQKNFYSFINAYRVNEFMERVIKPEYSNYKIIVLAQECGFNSKTSFNRIFKKHTGFTPAEYRTNELGE